MRQSHGVRLITLIGGNLAHAFAGLRGHRPRRGEPGVAYLSNRRQGPYHLQWQTTTGFIAARFWSGKVRVFIADGNGPPIHIFNAWSLTLWPCTSPGDRKKVGEILGLACPDSNLRDFDVAQLPFSVKYDYSGNPRVRLSLRPNAAPITADQQRRQSF